MLFAIETTEREGLGSIYRGTSVLLRAIIILFMVLCRCEVPDCALGRWNKLEAKVNQNSAFSSSIKLSEVTG